MRHAAWRSVIGHKSRFLLSLLAVVLGIAFMVGALTFTGMMEQSFQGITKGTISDVDVSPKGSYDTENPAAPDPNLTPLTDADLAKIAGIDDVESAVGLISTMGVYPLNQEGRVTGLGQGAPSFGFSWMTEPAFDHQPGLVLDEGRAPAADDEVALDPSTLKATGVSIGDEVDIATNSGKVTKTVVGTARWGSGGTVGAQYTFFTVEEAQRLFLDGEDGYQMGWVTVVPGADRAAVADRVNEVLPSGWEATDGEQVSEVLSTFIDQGLQFVNTFLLVFAAIGLIVAVFLIVNTFSILVAQRARELALFRALGASRGQVGRTVLFEALVIGVVGSILGILGGMALAQVIAWLLSATGMDLSSTRPIPDITAVASALVVGISVTMLSAWLPSRQAARIPPVAAMTGQFEKHNIRFGRLEFVAVALTAVGIAGLLVGSLVLDDNEALVVGIGAVLTLLGVAGLAPFVGRPLLWALGQSFRGLFGTQGKLADLNTVRQPRRTSATASALMIGLTLVTALGVLGSSASMSIDQVVQDSMRGDFDISSVAFDGLPAQVGEDVAKVDGVADAVLFRDVFATNTDGDFTSIRAFEPEYFSKAVAQELVAGEVFGERAGEVVVSQGYADKHSLSPGDTHQVVNPVTQQPYDLKVTGVFSVPAGVELGSINSNFNTAADLGSVDNIASITVIAEEGADLGEVKAGLQEAVADFPMLVVLDKAEYAERQTGMVNNLLNFVYALLGLAIVIAVLGIINTLVLSTIERTRELGLLRAVGMQRGQLRTMITLESVAISVLGATLGMVLGVAFGSALQRVLADEGLNILVIPWGQLAMFLGLAVVVGVLAALWPANKAAKRRILDAIAHE